MDYFIVEDFNFDGDDCAKHCERGEGILGSKKVKTDEQKELYSEIMNLLSRGSDGYYFAERKVNDKGGLNGGCDNLVINDAEDDLETIVDYFMGRAMLLKINCE